MNHTDSAVRCLDSEFGLDSIEHRTVTHQLLNLFDRPVGGFLANVVFSKETGVMLPEPLSISRVLLTGGDVIGQSPLEFSNPILVG